MEVIKRFTAIQLGTQKVNHSVNVTLTFGDVEGPYYDETSPTEEFDSEEEAINYAYRFNPYGRWLICPIVSFSNYPY